MATNDYPLVNGTAYGYAKCEIRAGTKRFRRTKSVNYSDSLEPGMGRGTSVAKEIRTTGVYDAEGDIEIYRDDWTLLKTELGGDGYMETEFQVVISYQAKNQPMMTDTLVGCRIKKVARGGEDGNADPLTVKLDLDIMLIKDNNQVPVKGMVG